MSRRVALLALTAALCVCAASRADEPVVTILADFEDDSVAATITDVENVLAADCTLRRRAIPARGQKSLAVEIGATERDAAVACDLRFRVATRFEQADRVAGFCWIKRGRIELSVRILDARDQVFETAAQTIEDRHRWVHFRADLATEGLRRVRAASDPVWPIRVLGFRVRAQQRGRQTVYIDDLQVEHRAELTETVRGGFRFDRPTKFYEPRSEVGVAIELENISRRRAARLSIELDWMRPDGTVLRRQFGSVTLPPGGQDFRSRQALDFSQRVVEPGVVRLVARVRAVGWTAAHRFETSVAVAPSNRNRPRGRSNLFAVRSNLLLESPADQRLEIELAREIGVNLLAVETPWRMIEPKAGDDHFDQLDVVIQDLTDRNIAPMIALLEPPQWLVAAPARPHPRLVRLLETLVHHYGDKVSFYQLDEACARLAGDGNDPAALATLQKRMQAIQPKARLVSAPLRIPAAVGAQLPADEATGDTGPQRLFLTEGRSGAALIDVRNFARTRDRPWRGSDWWQHNAEPLIGTGHASDAVTVLRHYVRAAAAGVAGLIWFDLRDDSADPKSPQSLRGLVSRDFSPKTSALGYASAAGSLSGLRFAGSLLGAPAEFESALFIGRDRQVAVLLPRPNRILPALLAPIRGVPGTFAAEDFERRRRPLLQSQAPPLITTAPRPLFVTLKLENAQPEPQLALARPWLRVPAVVFAGAGAEFPIEIDVPFRLRRRSFLQLVLPADSPLESSFGARALKAAPGETLRFSARLTTKNDEPFERTALTLRLTLEGRRLNLPLEVRPLSALNPLSAGKPLTAPQHLLGRLRNASDPDADVGPALYAAYAPKTLHLALTLDRAAAASAAIRFGVAVQDQDDRTEVEVRIVGDTARLAPLDGAAPARIKSWRCTVSPSSAASAVRTVRIDIPIESLGLSALTPQRLIRLAARMTTAAPSASDTRWGGGLAGSRSSTEFRWLRVVRKGG